MNKLFAFSAAFAIAASTAACHKTAELNLGTVGDTMAYDTTAFTVKTGQTVHVVLTNHATSAVMKHNWVLVKPGTEAKVATAGMTAGEAAGYVPAGDADVLAHTPLSQPGTQVETSFTAPAPGSYPFMCTFPGHYQTMHGTLTVTP
ncbi:MAG TPA: plastocyanin/azurin family copper-binding protein [Polyangiaceae bacterium]|jgi:azurin